MDDIDRFLLEDLNLKGDITSDALLTTEQVTGIIIAKESCIIAGLDEAKIVFTRSGSDFNAHVPDGENAQPNTIIATVAGSARSILKAERLALNFLGRMSGIATTTRSLVEQCKTVNPKITIAATRKTTPGFRKYEKKAVQLGGGEPHRFGLYDAILIKDNHLKIIGSISEALHRIETNNQHRIIEIEVENEKDALIASSLNANVVMLDNFSPEQVKETTKKIRKLNPNILIEISGGITPKNILQYAPFADRISLGYLTHSVRNKDFSLELQ